jgi:4-hydroxy-tetrahydrodipicolinate synthase
LVTSFKDGNVDFAALKKLIEYQIEQGVKGVILAGTTGEAPMLELKERIDIIECAVAKANKRIQVWAGTGTNCTRTTLVYTKEIYRLGVEGVLVVAPYYNRPHQEWLYIHFSRIAEATDKPILLYSIPTRYGVEISIGVFERGNEDCESPS